MMKTDMKLLQLQAEQSVIRQKEVLATQQTENGPANTAPRQLTDNFVSVVAATFNSTNRPLALTFQSTIQGINEALAPYLGDDAIARAIEEGLDVSPEATAGRIVGQSTQMFHAFRERHSDLSHEQAVDKFVDVISGGIEQGFAEARGILEGLKVLQGEIAENIDLTYELVKDGVASFMTNQLNPESKSASAK